VPDAEDLARGRVTVVAAFNDPDRSPAMVEATLGAGHVLVVASTADGDWTTWPSNPSYIVTALEMVRHMAPRRDEANRLAVGAPIRYALDPARYASEVRVVAPGRDEGVPVQAVAGDDGGLVVRFAGTERRGFYTLVCRRHEGGDDRVLYAVNIAESEGDLRRADRQALRARIGRDNISFVRGAEGLLGSESAGRVELWSACLFALALVLGAEQFLAWLFGRRR